MGQREIDTAREEAMLTLLKRIKESAAETSNGIMTLRLAETYAWVQYPNQPHGGAGAADSK